MLGSVKIQRMNDIEFLYYKIRDYDITQMRIYFVLCNLYIFDNTLKQYAVYQILQYM